jgi:radical SAM superfamily enzyme YgiQ (UPF0313 family)
MSTHKKFISGSVKAGDIILLDLNMNASTPDIPLGIGFIAAQLKKSGIPYILYDQSIHRLSLLSLVQELIKRRPKLLGFSCYTWSVWPSSIVAQTVREALPDCLIVFGGPFVTGDPDLTFAECRAVDVVVRGDGEHATLDIINAEKFDDLFSIDGLSFRTEQDSPVFHTPDRTLVHDLDTYPSPYLEGVFDLVRYMRFPTNRSRGCFQNCKFCAWGTASGNGSYREHSLERLIEELKCAARVGHHTVIPHDGTFNYPTNFIFEFRDKLLRNNLHFKWYDVDMRADLVSFDHLQALKEIGAVEVGFGYETANKQSQKRIGKNLDVLKLENVLVMSKELGLNTHCGFIVGLPGESEEDVHKSAEFAKQHLKADKVGVFPLELLPGTEFYRNYSHYGIYRFRHKEGNPFHYDCGTNLLPHETILSLVAKYEKEVSEFNDVIYRKIAGYKRKMCLQRI